MNDKVLVVQQEEKNLNEYLKSRGRIITTEGEIVQPPARKYGNIQAEILDLLCHCKIPMSPQQMSSWLGIPRTSINKALYRMARYLLDDQYLLKVRKGGEVFYTSSLPPAMDIPALVEHAKKKRDTLKGIPPSRDSLMKRLCDVLNTYLVDGKRFTREEFAISYQELYEEEISKASLISFISKAVKRGFLTSQRRISDNRKRVYIKVKDIPEDETKHFGVNIAIRKPPEREKTIASAKKIDDEEVAPTFFDEDVKVSYKKLKEMEQLIIDQHNKILQLITEKAGLFDEVNQSRTEITVLKERTELLAKEIEALKGKDVPSYSFDTEKFSEILH
jgi:hypothetical protein